MIDIEKNDNTIVGGETDTKTPKCKDPIDVDSLETNNEGVKEANKRKLKSIVWNHFTKKKKINGIDKVVCNYCNRKLSSLPTFGTRHLHDDY